MSSVQFRTLEDKDFPEWCAFHDELYGKGYVFTDWDFLRWYLKRDGKYETLIAVDGKTIVGVYGVLQFPLWVKDAIYEACWMVNGMVRPEYRNQGIGKTFVNMLLDRFDVCGGIGFNEGARRNYVRAGFKQFDSKTLRRFAYILREDAYSLMQENHRESMKALVFSRIPFHDEGLIPIENTSTYKIPQEIKPLKEFDASTIECFNGMKRYIGKATLERTPEYLNWRYFQNPKLQYECHAVFAGGRCTAYIVSRHERFYPTNFYATRIIDLIGLSYYVSSLIAHEINEAIKRNDAFIDFSCTGDYYARMLKCLRFSELCGQQYGALPLVSSPIEYRENEEFICLGSRKHPNLFDDVEFDDLYFTRGDADRDRYNSLKVG
jgi:GNAT superfamily N-acetyltransferase